MPALTSNKLIRKTLKLRRSQLSKQQLALAAHDIGQQFGKHPLLFNAKKIAAYLPASGEISPLNIIERLPHAQTFLPKITSMHRFSMAFYSSNNQLIRNRFNIEEPVAKGIPVNLRYLDVVLIPLVAFDRNGNRIGMGKGFYDRALAFKNHYPLSTRPRLIGVAHHFQEVNDITPQTWDVRLDAILTNKELIKITF